MRTRDVMQNSPIQVLPGTPFLELQRLFITAQISGAPVVDARGVVVGVVTLIDLLRAVDQVCDEDIDPSHPDESGERSNSEDLPERLGSLTAEDVMSPDVVWVSPEATVNAAAHEMRAQGIHHVLVGDNGDLLGIVSALDLLQTPTPSAATVDAPIASTETSVEVERRVQQNVPAPTSSARPPLGTVVVGLDHSANARTALGRAARLPLQLGGTLELVTAIDEEQFTAIVAHREGEARQLLDDARLAAERALPDAGMHHVVVSFSWGAPFAVIGERAHHARAELVVVGRHGDRRFRDLLLGSTAERVVRNGSVSVLVVAAAPEAPYRRPLVAIDMSDSSRMALEVTARLCAADVETIDVLHVISHPARMHAQRDSQEQSARAELSAFVATVNAGVAWNSIVQFGDPRALILDEATRRDADLVAVGTTGRKLARVLLGSVAEGVLRFARCDVLVARLPAV